MMEEDLRIFSKLKKKQTQQSRSPEPMEVDEKKTEVKVEAKRKKRAAPMAQPLSPVPFAASQEKLDSCSRGLTWRCFSVMLGVHYVDAKAKAKKNSIPFLLPFLLAIPSFRNGGSWTQGTSPQGLC